MRGACKRPWQDHRQVPLLYNDPTPFLMAYGPRADNTGRPPASHAGTNAPLPLRGEWASPAASSHGQRQPRPALDRPGTIPENHALWQAIHHSRASSQPAPTEGKQSSPANANHVVITQHGRLRVWWDAELHQRRPRCLDQGDRHQAHWRGPAEAGRRHADHSQSQSIVAANGFAKLPASETP
jgi:hypothetical protein